MLQISLKLDITITLPHAMNPFSINIPTIIMFGRIRSSKCILNFVRMLCLVQKYYYSRNNASICNPSTRSRRKK